jgi:hypothetical protein
MLDFIKRYEADGPKQHLVGMTVGFPSRDVDDAALFASRADWISPSEDRVADGTKVVIFDSDHAGGRPMAAPEVWRAFVHGEHPISMDTYEERPELEPARRAMGYARSYAERLDLAAAAPRGDLSDTGYCLAAPGSEYVVYQPDPQSRFHVDLLAGSYHYEWFDPGAGRVAASGVLAALGGWEAFDAPFAGDAVLYLKARPGDPLAAVEHVSRRAARAQLQVAQCA